MPDKITGCPLARHSTRLATRAGLSEDIGLQDVGSADKAMIKYLNLVHSASGKEIYLYTEYCTHLYGVATASVYTAIESYDMTRILRHSSCIARRAVKQGTRPAMVTQVAVEKSATENKT